MKSNRVSRISRCVTQTNVTIPPRTEALIPTYLVYNRLSGIAAGENWSTMLTEPASGIRVARILVDSGSPRVVVRCCNITDRPVRMYRGQTVSQLHAVDALDTHSAATSG